MNKNVYDYKELGLCCGLELHQQLDTNKLFCNCRSLLIKDDSVPDKIIKRNLRPVYSETGEFDKTAISEFEKKKTYTYYFYNKSNCLVDIDCQPPKEINREALKIALTISKLTNSTLVNKSIVMRKQVLDGSNVSGFQRTAMISTSGFLDFDFGRVRIDKILLEEDSSRAIERKETETIYSLDRLGIPLIELVVWHDMHTPEQVKIVAQNVGQLFRTTGKTKRGLGSIRQDINISIKNGNRTEIKGCQDLNLIPEIIDREIERQLSLLDIKSELKKRSISSFSLKEKDISSLFKNTNSKVVLSSLSQNKKIFAFSIKNFKGLLGKELQPNRRLGTEVSSVLKAKTKVRGLFHSDELPNYGITETEVTSVFSYLNLTSSDSFILIMCSSDEISQIKDILNTRLNQLLVGIPKETRIVTPEGNTEYQRDLSEGGSRMYPETDLLPISFPKELLKEVEGEMPLSLDKRRALYTSYNLNNQLIEKMLLDNYATLFEKILKHNSSLNPTTVAVFLLEDLTTWAREGLIVLENVSQEDLFAFFSYSKFNDISKSKIKEVFTTFINNNKTLEETIEDLNIFKELESLDLNTIIQEILEENKQKILEQDTRAEGLLMGLFMKKTKGLVEGAKASKLVKENLASFLEKHKAY